MLKTSIDTRTRTDAESIEADPLLQLYRWMLLSRQLDMAKADLVNRGEAFFHISGCGHEGMATLRLHLTPNDWLHLHYRDQALALATGVPPEAYLNSVLCNSGSYCQGRQMSAMLSYRPLNILSTTTSVGNSALQAVGVAMELKHRAGRPIVVCSMGDGTSQQGEVMEAIAEAARADLPVLFVIEDNGYSISTPTAGKTFYSPSRGAAEPQDFFGLPIHRLDGRDVVPCHRQLGPIVETIRATRRAAIVVFRVERLADHSNADDERTYRSEDNRRAAQRRAIRSKILRCGCSAAELRKPRSTRSKKASGAEILAAVEHSLMVEQPRVVFDAKAELRPSLGFVGRGISRRRRNRGRPANGKSRSRCSKPMREVLRARLAAEPRVCLFGEDIEDPEGRCFRRDARLIDRVSRPRGQFAAQRSDDRRRQHRPGARRRPAGRVLAVHRFSPGDAESNHVRTEHDALAHGRRMDLPGDRHGGLRRLSPWAGPVSFADDGIDRRAPAGRRCVHAGHRDRCRGPAQCGLRVAAADAVSLSESVSQRSQHDDFRRRRAAACADRQGPLRHARRSSDDRRLGEHRSALRKSRGRDRRGRPGGRFDRFAIDFALGPRGGDRIGRADRKTAGRA